MIIMNMSKKVIITGVTGQDGSYMADYLLDNFDYQIYGMVRRTSTNNYFNIKHLLNNNRFKLITGDLTDSQSIDNIIREIQPDYFINLAAQSFVGSSWQIPEQTFDIDAIGVIRCLEAIRKHSPHCRFYNAGSSEELGNVNYSPQDENHPLKPRSPYGAAKAAARHIVKVYRESYNLYAIQGLLYNHESERRGEEFVTRKITKNVARIKNSIENNIKFDPIELGNINVQRDWSHAKDFVKGIWLMLNQEYPKEYILASGETHTVKEFIEKAFMSAGINYFHWEGEGVNEKLVIDNFILEEFKISSHLLVKINPIFYRPAEVDLLLGCPNKAKQELNWDPKISFNKLVDLMVKNDLNLIKESVILNYE
jgi:GDPmannose 4,6-dehydratase